MKIMGDVNLFSIRMIRRKRQVAEMDDFHGDPVRCGSCGFGMMAFQSGKTNFLKNLRNPLKSCWDEKSDFVFQNLLENG